MLQKGKAAVGIRVQISVCLTVYNIYVDIYAYVINTIQGFFRNIGRKYTKYWVGVPALCQGD